MQSTVKIATKDLMEDQTEEQKIPFFYYTVELKDGTVTDTWGHIYMGPGFYAFIRDERIMYDVWPEDQIKHVRNNGPVETGNALN